jgi:hypothetical protein
MRELTEAEKRRLWDEVRAEFPDDDVMQQVHFVRLGHHLLMKNLSAEARIQQLSRLPEAG